MASSLTPKNNAAAQLRWLTQAKRELVTTTALQPMVDTRGQYEFAPPGQLDYLHQSLVTTTWQEFRRACANQGDPPVRQAATQPLPGPKAETFEYNQKGSNMSTHCTSVQPLLAIPASSSTQSKPIQRPPSNIPVLAGCDDDDDELETTMALMKTPPIQNIDIDAELALLIDDDDDV
ncbi:hypothetical protein IWQ62_005770, partial [Dispira parvispora]